MDEPLSCCPTPGWQLAMPLVIRQCRGAANGLGSAVSQCYMRYSGVILPPEYGQRQALGSRCSVDGDVAAAGSGAHLDS